MMALAPLLPAGLSEAVVRRIITQPRQDAKGCIRDGRSRPVPVLPGSAQRAVAGQPPGYVGPEQAVAQGASRDREIAKEAVHAEFEELLVLLDRVAAVVHCQV